MTLEPSAEDQNGETVSHSGSEIENRVEELTSPAVELNLSKPEPAVELGLPAIEPDFLVDEPGSPAVDPAVPEEPAVETVVTRSARRQLATYLKGPEDDVPLRYGRTRAQTRSLEQDNSSVVRDNVFDVVWKPTVMVGRMENSSDNPAERDLEGSTQMFHTLLADDQSSLKPRGHIGKHRSLVEAELLQSYSAGCDSANWDI